MRFPTVGSVFLVLALAVAAPQAAFAQGKPAAPAAAAGKRARVLEKIRAVRAARIIQALNLDEATATRLFAVLDRYDDQILTLKREVADARRQLRAMLDGGKLDDAAANRQIDRIVNARAEIAKLEVQRATDVRKVLSVRQFGALVIALPEIERDIEQRIRRALDRRGGGGAGEAGDFE
jgi:Spy/CpxP family protein refolding chaperone